MPDQVLIRHDLQGGPRLLHDFGPGRHVGEFVFEPKHAGAAEDEGWLMGYVVDANRQTSALLILDAQDFAGPPVATVHIPHIIPGGFHGNWVPTAAAGQTGKT